MNDSLDSRPWWRHLTPYHWFVFAMASLAWMFDCLDQQLFILARKDAMQALLGAGADLPKVNLYGGYATSIFMAGWAVGGLFFGAVGDRIGRAKTLAITVLIYSLSTGLSALSRNPTDFFIFRFLTGLGVGGVFGLSVALIADSLPEQVRSKALGWLQSLSAVGNITAGLCRLALMNQPPDVSWKYMFWIGAAPAFLCIFIMFQLKEPQKWVDAKRASLESGSKDKKMGSYMSLFGDARWCKSAILGMLLCIAGVVGLWGVGFFSPELVGAAIGQSLQPLEGKALSAAIAQWGAYNLIVQNAGAFIGMLCFARLAQAIGRKPAFLIGFISAFASTIFFFQSFNGKEDIWMSAVMGFCQLGLFAGFAIYLPELFPTRLRSTGTSFCYNVGRFVAASGPFTLGYLQKYLSDVAIADLPTIADDVQRKAAETLAKVDAFRDAACWLASIYLIGILVLPFLPETKGKPLPED